jgi:hexulose-6-phosphate isomerase
MKKGINYWALPIEMTLAQKFRFAKYCGFDGVELVILMNGELSANASKKELEGLRNLASSEGIEIPSLTNSLNWTCSFTSDNPEVRNKASDVLKRQIDIAFELGVQAVLALPGFVSVGFEINELHPTTDISYEDSYLPSKEVIQYDLAYERAIEGFKAIADYARSANVKVCIENIWNKFLLSPLEMRNFIDEIGSPYIASYFDVGNVNPFGIPQHWIKILGKRIERVHLKDYRNGFLSLDGFVNLTEGDIDLNAVAEALHLIGYDGWVTAEVNVDPSNPERIALAASQAMDKIFMVGGK